MKKPKLFTLDPESMEFLQKLADEIIARITKEVPQEEEYYDNADMKKLLHVDDSTLFRHRKANLLPYFKLGGTIYYPKSAIMNAFKK